MKHLKLFTPLAIGAVLLLSACGDKAPETPKGPVKYDLQAKLPKGYTHVMTMTHTETMTMGGENAPPPMTSEMTMSMRETVTDVDASGAATFSSTYESMSGKMPMPDGKVIEFNTATPSDDPAAQQFYGMIGKKTSYKMAPNGTVSNTTSEMDPMWKGMFWDTTYTCSIQLEEMLNTFNYTPPQPVDSGATWTASNGTRAMYPMWFETTYKLVKADSNESVIEFTSKITPHPKAIPDAMMGTMTDWKLNGTRTGTVVVDTKTGAPKRSDMTTNVSGTMITKGDGKKKKDVETPITLVITDKMEFTKQ